MLEGIEKNNQVESNAIILEGFKHELVAHRYLDVLSFYKQFNIDIDTYFKFSTDNIDIIVDSDLAAERGIGGEWDVENSKIILHIRNIEDLEKCKDKIEHIFVHELIHGISRQRNNLTTEGISWGSGVQLANINQSKGTSRIFFEVLDEALTEKIAVLITNFKSETYTYEREILDLIISRLAVDVDKRYILSLLVDAQVHKWSIELKDRLLGTFGENVLQILSKITAESLENENVRKLLGEYFGDGDKSVEIVAELYDWFDAYK